MKRLCAAAIICISAACGGSPSTPSDPAVTTTLQGVVAGFSGGQLQSGTMSATVEGEVSGVTGQGASAPSTGTLRLSGAAAVSLTGSYDTTTKQLTLAGGGFSFTGTSSSAVVNGTYTGPGGASGNFSTRSTATGTVNTYCGHIFGTDGAVTGAFNLVVTSSTGAMSGAFHVEHFSGFVNGQVTGGSFTLTYTDPVANQSGTATGTIQGTNVSGVSATGNAFSGSTAGCQ